MLGIIGAAAVALPATARISPADYRDVGVSVPKNAGVPRTVMVTDSEKRHRSLDELITRPTVLIFVDYTCRTLCGPVIDFVAAALEKSNLDADQYQLLVIGLDPKEGEKEATEMRNAHIQAGSPGDHASKFVTADASDIQMLTAALGYRYRYSAEDDVYVHPAAAYVLNSSGRVTRVLTGLGLSGSDMRLALIEASEGRIGTFGDQVRLLCSGFDPVDGAYNLMVWRVLELASLATVLTLGGSIGILSLAGRRHTA
jgi:protein SCO1/2